MLNVKAQVKAHIVEDFLFGKGADLTDDTSFLARGVLDSTGVLELVSFLEATYSIKVLDEELLPDNLDSLNAIDAYVRGKLNGGATSVAPAYLGR
jgi:acyl carrier protein